MDYRKNYEYWLNEEVFDEETKAELRALTDEKEIIDRFYKDLDFGTAGLRGIIGAGSNRMNKYVIRKTTQGLANYIIKQNASKKGVAIAFDSRHMSDEFADEAAMCLCANGIKVYLFDSLRPTPELSFAVRSLGCIAGLNITASHNPSEYNGYKVYWEDGAQITPPHDIGITKEVRAVENYSCLKTMEKEDAIKAGLLNIIGEDIDNKYIAKLKEQIKRPDCIADSGRDIKIVYSPLHGTGNIPVRRILKEIGFKNVFVVPEQEKPDGDFPTVAFPNPEFDEAFVLGTKLAKEVDADLILATDPDADRIGVHVKDSATGEYVALTGNMSGCLLAEYEISQTEKISKIPADGALIKTIVTTNMADAIAKNYGVRLIEVLTGFKYIGQQILGFEKNKNGTYLFGFEESYGSLIGTYARDKDAVVASMALCEAAAYYRTKGMSLWDAFCDMYERYGYYRDGIKSITLSGKEGIEKISKIMDTLRALPPTEVGGSRVVRIRDYKMNQIISLDSGKISETGLPVSNVLYYELTNDAWICIRPSGTEPKIKLYYGVKGMNASESESLYNIMGQAVTDLIKKLL